MEKLKENKLIVILFIFIACIEAYYKNYICESTYYDLGEWILYVVGDRFIILFILGLAAVITNYEILRSVFFNAALLIRYKKYSRVMCEYMKRILINNLFVLLGFMVITFIVAIPGGVISGNFIEVETCNTILKLVANIYMFMLVVGSFEMVVAVYGLDGKFICGIIILLLLINLPVSGSSGFKRDASTHWYWITNIMVCSDYSKYKFYLGYWFSWGIGCISLCMLRFHCNLRRIIDYFFYHINEIIKAALLSILVFLVYGNVCTKYTDSILECFVGFKKFDRYIIMYLLYQLPIWGFLYTYIVRRIKVYWIANLIRGKKMIFLYSKLFFEILMISIIYYATGSLLLIYAFGQSVSLQNIILLCNIVLQTMMIVSVAVFLWLFEGEAVNIGFVITMILHLILVGVANSVEKNRFLIPLTGGNYASHFDCMTESCIIQTVYLIFMLITMYMIMSRNKEILVLKKTGDYYGMY